MANGDEQTILATFSGGQDGKVREVFCASFKEGTDLQSLIVDACVLVSRELQSGVDAAELSKKLSRPKSIIGTLVSTAAKIDKELSNEPNDG